METPGPFACNMLGLTLIQALRSPHFLTARTTRTHDMTQRFSFASALLFLGCAALSAPAQVTQQIEADTAFAEGLARRWQFVDLAEEVLDGIQSEYSLSPTQTEKLGLVRCEVYATAARRERDPVERSRLYTEALKAYDDFLDANSYSTLRPEAEAALVQLANNYANVLELELPDLVGDEAQAMRDKIRGILEKPLLLTGKLVDDLSSIQEPTDLEKRELYSLMLDRGRMLATMGRVSEDGTFYYGQAKSVLENVGTLAGDMSGWGLQAYMEYARVSGSEGNWVDAKDIYQFVVDAVLLSDADWAQTKKDLSQADQDFFWAFTELSLPGLLEAATATGDTKMATTYALRFWNRYKAEGFTLSLPRGYLAVLATAETMLDAGGYVGGKSSGGDLKWFDSPDAMAAEFSSRRDQRSGVDMALEMAQLVNEDNKGNTLQTRAQKLISKIIESPGVELGPELLFEAASGHYADRNYAEAITGLKRVMAALSGKDSATRAEFGPKVLNKLGRAYANEKRYLEATMTFREAVKVWGGDPVYDSTNAKDMLSAVTVLRGTTKGDPLINDLFLEAERIVVEKGNTGDNGDILFRQAMRLYEEKDFDDAFKKFKEIEAGSASYEKGLVYMGACRYRTGQDAAARELFNDYLVDYLGASVNATTSESLLATRAEARALATYYMGRMADKDGNDEDTLKYLADFHKEFPGQDQMAPNTLYMSLDAFLELGRVPDARRQYEAMTELYPDHSRTGRAATLIYKAVSDLYKKEPADSAQAKAYQLTLAELMRTSNRLDDKPSYSDLRRESGHWLDLGNWTEAERVLRRTSKAYEGDKATRDGWYKNVQPDLGLVLLKQNKLPDALEVLRPLIPDAKPAEGAPEPEFKPYSSTVMSFFEAAVGKVKGDSGSDMVEVIGAGTREDVLKAAQWMEVLSRTKEKFTVDWYDLKFNQIFAWRRLGQTESNDMNIAKDLIGTMRTDVDANFDGIANDYKAAGLDGKAAQARYRWLAKELN